MSYDTNHKGFDQGDLNARRGTDEVTHQAQHEREAAVREYLQKNFGAEGAAVIERGFGTVRMVTHFFPQASGEHPDPEVAAHAKKLSDIIRNVGETNAIQAVHEAVHGHGSAPAGFDALLAPRTFVAMGPDGILYGRVGPGGGGRG